MSSSSTLALGCALVVVMLTTSARADRLRVVSVRTPAASTEVRDTLRRTEAELLVEGFVVMSMDAATSASLRGQLTRAAADRDAVAAVAVSRRGGAVIGELWIRDPSTAAATIHTVRVADLPAAEQPRALAIRIVEKLRATVMRAPTEPSSSSLPDESVDSALPLPPAPLAGFGLQLSVALLTGFDGIGPAGAPLLRFGYGSDAGFVARLSVLGPAVGVRLAADQGDVTVRQELATVDFAFAPAVQWRGLTPMVWVGGGVYPLFAEGELRAPAVGRADQVWAAVGTAGVAMGYRLAPRFTAWLDAAVVVTAPRPVVTVFGEPIGRTGRPSLLSSLGVAVRF